jgi:hypothetical protein
MLDPITDLPAGVVGLRANGTVIAQDVSQALTLASVEADRTYGLIVFVDPDLDGYLAEIVAALDMASEAEPALFQQWALVVPDDFVSEAEQYRGAGRLKVFPQSRRNDALAHVATER